MTKRFERCWPQKHLLAPKNRLDLPDSVFLMRVLGLGTSLGLTGFYGAHSCQASLRLLFPKLSHSVLLESKNNTYCSPVPLPDATPVSHWRVCYTYRLPWLDKRVWYITFSHFHGLHELPITKHWKTGSTSAISHSTFSMRADDNFMWSRLGSLHESFPKHGCQNSWNTQCLKRSINQQLVTFPRWSSTTGECN